MEVKRLSPRVGRTFYFSGIRSAYRAYQSHVALYGPDPQLPDPEFGGYTNDQLFFLSFAQVWCQPQATDNQLRRQILVDPHSPSEYRVFGAIQNFPQFRAAFNCPVGSKYAPNNSCQVWTSEVTPGKRKVELSEK